MIEKKIIKVNDLYFVFNSNKTAWIAVTKEALPLCENYINCNGKVDKTSMSSDELQVIDGLNQLEQANLEIDQSDDYKSCYIHITQTCNLKCPYCYSKDSLRNQMKDHSIRNWEIAIKKIREAGFHRLVFSGGEPLMYNGIEKILEYCSEMGFEEVDLITNGLLINEKNIVTLKKHVHFLSVSLDGCNEETNSPTRGEGNFSKIVDNIILLRNNSIPVNIIATIYKENIENISDYLVLAKSLDSTVSFSLFTISGEASKNQKLQQTETQLSSLSKYLLDDDTPQLIFDNVPVIKGIQYREGCGAGKYLISVNADGNVYPCHFMMEDALKLGNIFTDEVNVLLANGEEHSINMNVSNIKECSECKFKNFCGGGCRANTYKGKGKIRPSDDCQFYKSYYNKIISGFM